MLLHIGMAETRKKQNYFLKMECYQLVSKCIVTLKEKYLLLFITHISRAILRTEKTVHIRSRQDGRLCYPLLFVLASL